MAHASTVFKFSTAARWEKSPQMKVLMTSPQHFYYGIKNAGASQKSGHPIRIQHRNVVMRHSGGLSWVTEQLTAIQWLPCTANIIAVCKRCYNHP